MSDWCLIIWDEASISHNLWDIEVKCLNWSFMSHKASVEAFDRTLRDLRNSNCPMGGCTVLFSGDFHQMLPVITRTTRADEVNASLKRSHILPHVTKCELKTNMRILSSNEDDRQFSNDLLQIGNGEFQAWNVCINLNNICVLVQNVEEIIEKVYLVTYPLRH